jgi:hypothetical protein
MQNKPNFRKSQMDVNKVLTREYEKMDTWLGGKNKPNSKPIQTQSNPIKANKTPKQTQFKPNSNPNKPNFRGKNMLLRLTINPRPNSFAHYADQIQAPNACDRPAKKYRGRYPVLNLPANFARRRGDSSRPHVSRHFKKLRKRCYLLFFKVPYLSERQQKELAVARFVQLFQELT